MARVAGPLSIAAATALAGAALVAGALPGPLVFIWGMAVQFIRF